MKRLKALKWIIFSIAVAINLFILINSFIGGDASTAESSVITGTAANVVNGISPGTITNDKFQDFIVFIRKLFGHFGLFCFSGVFTTWAFYLFSKPGKSWNLVNLGLVSLGAGIVVATLSEIIQLFIPGRSGSIDDVRLDFIGYFIGVLLVIFVIFLVKTSISRKQKQQEK